VILDGNLLNSNSDWGEIRHGVSQGSILGLLLILLYINDLPEIVNDNSEVVLYVDDTSIIITSLNPTDFTNSANKILQDIRKWFTTNPLSLNADKTKYMQFVTKTSSLIDLHVKYKNKELANTSNTKFLELLLLCRYNRDPNLKIYYKQYCRILTRVISVAKRMILKSNNKVKSTWRIINEEKGNIKSTKGIHSIMIGEKVVVTNQEKIATAFNKYFLSIADSIIPENNNHTNKEIVNPIN
jgi:hypothetical protein